MNGFHAIRKATADDIFFIRALEMDPANIFVHDWDEATHLRNLADPKFLYLIAEDVEGTSLGFAILIANDPDRLEWRRVIVARRDDGIGTAFMKAVLHHAFNSLGANVIWLDVYENNDRARHVYRSLGFLETGEDLRSPQGDRLLIMECRAPSA